MSVDREKLLEKVGKLLNKADRAGTPEEAEAFFAKAQELITDHALDVALIDAKRQSDTRADQIVCETVPVPSPYARQKWNLLTVIADTNNVKAIGRHISHHHWPAEWPSYAGYEVKLVGYETEVRAVEMLFAQLLIFVERECLRQSPTTGDTQMTAHWRKDYITGFTTQIWCRLLAKRDARIADRDDGSLLPVLRDRKRDVDDAFAEMFPSTKTSKDAREIKNADAYYGGKDAANRAQIDKPVGGKRGELT